FLGRAVPGQDPLHVNVAAVPYRQWLVRRGASPPTHRDSGVVWKHLLRSVVSDRGCAADRRDRCPVGTRDPACQDPRRTLIIATRIAGEQDRLPPANVLEDGCFPVRCAILQGIL